MTDLELLRAAHEDPEAFGAFYHRHVAAVERWIQRQTPDPGTAADLTGETFAQALVSLPKFRGSTDEAARGWLYGIARNLVRRYHRRGRVELAMCVKLGIRMELDGDELSDLDDFLDAATAGPALERALDALPDTQQEALQLRIVDGLDHREAAAQMGTSEPNARIRVSRALRALSTRLQGAPPPMTPQTDLPDHLERFGQQLIAAAHERRDAPSATERRWRRPTLIATPVLAAAVAAVAAVVILVTTAGPTTPKAYALTANGDGSYTLTINDIATAVPHLNAAFARLGIHAKAIPVTADCTPQRGTFIPPLMSPDQKARPDESITLSNSHVPAGWTTYIAAEQTPTGIRLSVGSTAAPLPSCLNSHEAPPVIINPVVRTNGTTSTTG